jgi:hypothetical protein
MTKKFCVDSISNGKQTKRRQRDQVSDPAPAKEREIRRRTIKPAVVVGKILIVIKERRDI